MNRTINRTVGFVFGATYVLVGLLGFTVSGGHAAIGHEGGKLLGLFMVNTAHNVVHLAVGATLILAAWASLKASKATNGTIGAVYLLLAVVGPFIQGNTTLNMFALNNADHFLHAASAFALLGIAVAADKARSPRHTAATA